jgi:hypothetical protein
LLLAARAAGCAWLPAAAAAATAAAALPVLPLILPLV